ncbi:hypothetical protein B9G69_002345 [Bdellovibrio sp. SKB1291214]|uniref:hypothetical protein n=1 Tax=Bdellovibrio sp. SKB1291214 TaxID=1732569 RepID=UPI000B51AC87|nr:hypothetical protein [Bdellovibrio sp. SKB1291214]UYL09412.1 hypothetical protein B9G69_002345 [Bdellovibrio sp. SKB1291214]
MALQERVLKYQNLILNAIIWIKNLEKEYLLDPFVMGQKGSGAWGRMGFSKSASAYNAIGLF